MNDDIQTSAEALESAAIPRMREVHADPNVKPGAVPETLQKTPAR